jgi:hypothetical protein
MSTRRSAGGSTSGTAPVARYGIEYAGHEIEVRVDGDDLSADRVRVLVDGTPVDRDRLTVRSHDVGLVTDDGVEIRLHVGGRVLDRLVRVRLRRPDGYWIDLEALEGPGVYDVGR